MQPHETHDDKWVPTNAKRDAADPRAGRNGLFEFETFDSVRPLSKSDDLDGDLKALGPLYPMLFEPLTTDEDDTAQRASPATFAVLDAGRVMYLPEVLAGSGLKHACLFKGAAFDEMGDVAPWLVALDPKSQFTRRLFLSGDVPWHMWEKEPGSFFRSSLSFEDVYKHFRKLTKVKLSDGRDCYFRFWEPRWIIRILETMEAKQLKDFMDPLSAVIATNRHGEVGAVKRL